MEEDLYLPDVDWEEQEQQRLQELSESSKTSLDDIIIEEDEEPTPPPRLPKKRTAAEVDAELAKPQKKPRSDKTIVRSKIRKILRRAEKIADSDEDKYMELIETAVKVAEDAGIEDPTDYVTRMIEGLPEAVSEPKPKPKKTSPPAGPSVKIVDTESAETKVREFLAPFATPETKYKVSMPVLGEATTLAQAFGIADPAAFVQKVLADMAKTAKQIALSTEDPRLHVANWSACIKQMMRKNFEAQELVVVYMDNNLRTLDPSRWKNRILALMSLVQSKSRVENAQSPLAPKIYAYNTGANSAETLLNSWHKHHGGSTVAKFQLYMAGPKDLETFALFSSKTACYAVICETPRDANELLFAIVPPVLKGKPQPRPVANLKLGLIMPVEVIRLSDAWSNLMGSFFQTIDPSEAYQDLRPDFWDAHFEITKTTLDAADIVSATRAQTLDASVRLLGYYLLRTKTLVRAVDEVLAKLDEAIENAAKTRPGLDARQKAPEDPVVALTRALLTSNYHK